MIPVRVVPDHEAPEVPPRPPGAGYLVSPTERYVIIEPLAEGGMGALYRGHRVGPGGFTKDVVLKQLHREFARDGRINELFLQEARLSATLDHPNIAATLDLVRSKDGYFIVMEYVRGADLRVLLRKARRRGRRLSLASALFLAQELLSALDYLHHKTDEQGHALGLLHRDISPANVLCSTTGAIKLTDFGIAGQIRVPGDLEPEPEPTDDTRGPLRVRGKIGYMSPEQARGEDLDVRSDLFSLAVVLYEVLVGERLFIGSAEGVQQNAALVYGQAVPPPSRRHSAIPPELDQVLLKALALQREARFSSAAELRVALRDIAHRHHILLGAAELCLDLHQVCGADPADWKREEDRTGTASIGAEGLDADEEGLSESDRGLVLVGETTVPIERMDASIVMQTTPLPRAAVEALGIAALARQMLPTSMKPRPSADAKRSMKQSAQRPAVVAVVTRGDETATLTPVRGTPAETRQVPLRGISAVLAGAAADAYDGPIIRLSQRNVLLLVAVVLALLGVGVTVGVSLRGRFGYNPIPVRDENTRHDRA